MQPGEEMSAKMDIGSIKQMPLKQRSPPNSRRAIVSRSRAVHLETYQDQGNVPGPVNFRFAFAEVAKVGRDEA